MPIALDGETVNVSLKTDEGKPVETRPAFVCHYLTCRQVLAYEKAIRAASEAKEQSEQNDLLDKALAIAIVGVKNLAGEIDDVLTPAEKWELSYTIPLAVQQSELDKKKSLSKSPSTGANSEASVPAPPTASSTVPIAPPLIVQNF